MNRFRVCRSLLPVEHPVVPHYARYAQAVVRKDVRPADALNLAMFVEAAPCVHPVVEWRALYLPIQNLRVCETDASDA